MATKNGTMPKEVRSPATGTPPVSVKVKVKMAGHAIGRKLARNTETRKESR